MSTNGLGTWTRETAFTFRSCEQKKKKKKQRRRRRRRSGCRGCGGTMSSLERAILDGSKRRERNSNRTGTRKALKAGREDDGETNDAPCCHRPQHGRASCYFTSAHVLTHHVSPTQPLYFSLLLLLLLPPPPPPSPLPRFLLHPR